MNPGILTEMRLTFLGAETYLGMVQFTRISMIKISLKLPTVFILFSHSFRI